jgi:hypothetical protein
MLKECKHRLFTRAARNGAHVFAETYRAATKRSRQPLFQHRVSLGLGKVDLLVLAGSRAPARQIAQ